jgi:4-carboxymuconolactone decarboxylase
MSDKARLKKGREVFKKVYGNVIHVPEKLTPYTENTLKNLFAEILSRDRLKMRDRRLLILGALAGLGADPSLFEIHMRSALGNGEIAYGEMEELCLVLVAYTGYPRTSPLYVICQKILAEKKSRKKAK